MNGGMTFFAPATAGGVAPGLLGYYWALLGNAGTVDGVNFIGTTDNIPFNFRLNNVRSGKIDHLTRNVSLGYQSPLLITTGVDNTLFGHQAGKAITEAIRCVFIGSGAGALFAGTTAQNSQDNVGVGFGALSKLTRDYANTAVGWSALLNQTSGVSNSAFGSGAGSLVTTGQGLTLLGASTDVTVGTESHSIALGYGAIISANNEMVVAGSGSFVTKVRWTYSGGGAQHQEFFRTATPEGAQVGTRGDIAYVDDGATGTAYIKATGSATNTGWLALITAVTGGYATLTGTETFSSGVKTFKDSILNIRNPADTFSYTIVAAAIAANRNLTLPLITGTDTLMVLGLNQTVTGILTLTTPVIGAATGTSLAVSGLLRSSSPTAGMGYATGAGGTQTQNISKATGVTLDKVCGQITMNGAALNATTSVQFTLTNSTISGADTVVVALVGTNTANSYTLMVDGIANGSCKISLRNYTGGTLSEAVVFNFSVIKGATS